VLDCVYYSFCFIIVKRVLFSFLFLISLWYWWGCIFIPVMLADTCSGRMFEIILNPYVVKMSHSLFSKLGTKILVGRIVRD
jgi:hypothetical protein